MIKQIAAAAFLSIFCFFSTSSVALTVFVDTNGDKMHDSLATVAPGDVFTVSVFAEVDNLHGGLAGFGVNMSFDEPPLTVNALPSKMDNVQINPSEWDFLPAKSVGTGVLTDANRHPDQAQMKQLVAQLAGQVRGGREIVVVSSGAVGAGMGVLRFGRRPGPRPWPGPGPRYGPRTGPGTGRVHRRSIPACDGVPRSLSFVVD